MNRQVSHQGTMLGWIREDVDKHLEHVRAHVEHLAGSPNIAREAILEPSERLEQLQLTLDTLMLSGASLMIGEMIALCQRLGRHRVDNRDKAYSALLDATVVLPSYLDRLQAGHQDLPMLLLPTINSLREAHNTSLLQESTLFTPSLDVELPELPEPSAEAAGDEPFTAFAARLKGQYENALLNWMQDQESVDLLSPLQGICETLMHRVNRRDVQRLWWVASEVVGGLLDGHLKNEAPLRRLFARLHLVLKKLAEGGEDAADTQSVNALTQALLHQVAGARWGNAALDDMKKRFQLDSLMPDQEEMVRARGAVTGRNREMYMSLGAAVQDELELVKDALDLELRTGNVDEERREQSLEALQRLQDTLRMLGLGATARSFEELLPEFVESAQADEGSRESVLMSVAEQLLLVESALREQIETLGEPLEESSEKGFTDLPAHELRRIYNQLLDESVASLYQFQEAVRTRFSGDPNGNLTDSLDEAAGALELLGDRHAADLAYRLRETTVGLIGDAMSESSVAPRHLELFTDAVAALELYVAASRDQQEFRDRFLGILEERLDVLEGGEEPEPVQRVPAPPGAAATTPDSPAAQAPAVESTPAAQPETIDQELLDVFLEEYDTVTESLQNHLPEWLASLDDAQALTEVRRSFHTLKGSGRMVGAFELGDFAWQIEAMLNALLDTRIRTFADAAVTVRLAQAALPALKQRLMQQPAGLKPEAIAAIGTHAERLTEGKSGDWDTLREHLPGYLAGMLPDAPSIEEQAGDDDEMLSVVRAELRENLVHVQALLEAISTSRATRTTPEQVRAVHTIAGTLAMEPVGREAEVARALEGLLEAQSQSGKPFSEEAVWALASSFGHMQARLDQLDGHEDVLTPENDQELIEQLITLTVEFELTETPSPPAFEAPADEESPAEAMPGSPELAEIATAGAEDESVVLQSEIVEIFMEEAREVLGRCDTLLDQWRDDLHELSIVQNLQREIHTFKGGARMAGLTAMGEFSHAMENLLERIAGRDLPPTVAAVQALEEGCDRLSDWVEEAGAGRLPDAADALAQFEQQVDVLAGQDLAGVEAPPAPEPAEPPPAPEAAEPRLAAEAEPPVTRKLPEDSARLVEKSEEAQGQSFIRVDADLLDALVNSAGEINILRSRLERHIGNLRGNLGEFDETLSRLREQFRKLEIETETQIRSRYQDTAEDGAEGFDPLEMDRFSSMQQLSRGLSESVADLLNLQELLDDAARQSESLLTQQSRFSTELQEGLMQTRMVPFGSIAPRLRRVVRTAAKDTGRKARLELRVAGASDQLDRNVLERITAPLEHMLRNSVAHGIEDPKQRKALRKKVEGEIAITVESEATEFVIRIQDDGAGINLEAIRKRAVKQGLIDAEASPPPQQLLEFILQSGFSTSETVTGLAGRGVGLDVVSSEIKQIGGSLEITTEEGSGTCFTIRIPFTLAVMQAIGVMAGDNRYLIPLASVAGVGRLLPADYRELLESEEPVYEFAGDTYPVLELEPLLGESSQPLGADHVSLLLIRAGDHAAAFRAPQLLGHREIVIKPVGPQISSVPGILGGTVTGDGSVVVILDPGPLIRHAVIHGVRPAAPGETPDKRERQTLAMVVDDSITMRKVTSRVLESRDFEVITARDGVDATEQMQERVPDLLLLDIEMPRMDGYAVAEHVRSDARLRHIPIMMITSRSGQKHRDRAERAGADAYLTKPYKETELVSEVYKLLGKETD